MPRPSISIPMNEPSTPSSNDVTLYWLSCVSCSPRPDALLSSQASFTIAARCSCPSPATPSLAACRRSSISATSAHYLAAASLGPKSCIFPNRSILATSLPAGVEDYGAQSRAVRLSSGWDLPYMYWPWEPLLVHDNKDNSWSSPAIVRLQGPRRARAQAHRRRLRGVA
jgi:hypothetical protein